MVNFFTSLRKVGRVVMIAPLLLAVMGFTYGQVRNFYPNGVSIYSYRGSENPVQIFTFESGLPERMENVTINGIPVESFPKSAAHGTPVQRNRGGQITTLSWYWSEHFDIRFSFKSREFRLPLNEFQLLQIFGRPKQVDPH